MKKTGVDLVKNNRCELSSSNVNKSGNPEITEWKEKKSKASNPWKSTTARSLETVSEESTKN